MYTYILIAILLLFTGCGPRYVIKNQYIPPQAGVAKGCLDNCSAIRSSCQDQCQRRYQYCLDDAYGKAKAVEQDELRAYDMAYNRYLMDFSQFQHRARNWDRDYFDYSRDFNHFQLQCERQKDAYSCQKRDEVRNHMNRMKRDKPREPWVPSKPSFEQILVTQQSFCSTNCGCEQTYDNCFVGCGGQVIPHKICVENCD
ncbi:MAG: hypothetical protein J0647_10385 [Campylobacteraceae bacterium]|nr:hypothetical protein [Campylobacteraceae bacterium]